MSKMQRAKGRRGELEVAALLRDQGFKADLIYGQEEVGGRDGDLDTDLGFIEVRRRQSLAKDLRPNNDLYGLAAREDRGPWLLVQRLSQALEREVELRECRSGNGKLRERLTKSQTSYIYKDRECEKYKDDITRLQEENTNLLATVISYQKGTVERLEEIDRLREAIKAIFDAKDQDERDRAFDAAEKIAREGR